MGSSEMNLRGGVYKKDIAEELSIYGINAADDLEPVDLCVLLAVASYHDSMQDSSPTESILDYIREREFFSPSPFDEHGESEVLASLDALVERGSLIEYDDQYAIPFETIRGLYTGELEHLVVGIKTLEKLNDLSIGVLLSLAKDRGYLTSFNILTYLRGMGIMTDRETLIPVLEDFIGDGIIEGGAELDTFCINPDYLRGEKSDKQEELFPDSQ
jgi:hypothetical protein